MKSSGPLRLIATLLCVSLLVGAAPVAASASGGQKVDVKLTESGPWVASLVGFDLSKVESVTYWVRDAAGRWSSLDPVTSEPFTAPVDWWLGDIHGYVAVTARVTLTSGKQVKDPGGWHWVNGSHANPAGSIDAWTNLDGTPGASYKPDSHLADIQAVEFWFRDAVDTWHNAGKVIRDPEDTTWILDSFPGLAADWKGADNAVSVHVIWPGGLALVDPAAWATNFRAPAESRATPSASVVAQPATAATCGDPHAHVYNPDRLQLLAACVTVTGIVDAVRKERDGDVHILLHLDPGQEKYLNAKNAQELGDLVLEPVCVDAVTQADAISACVGYSNPLRMPSIGAHISATGPWVLDRDHGWLEIHPVSSFGPVAASAPTAIAAPTPPPVAPAIAVAPAPPPPPPPAADPYAALRAQGVSAICVDGTYSYSQQRSGTCSHHGGVQVWTGLI